ncbi:MAG: methyl-accepting chemotaxis protein [Thermodesulfovibrionales bacterium]|nr:methyl-accepting chemotaxis protein [Thermodesulfovibrionales bacterium]
MRDTKRTALKRSAPKKTRLGIRTKIGGIVVMATLLMTGIVIYSLYTSVKSGLSKELEKRGVALASAFATSAANPVLTNSTDILKKMVTDMEKEEAVAYSLVANDEGKILAHSFGTEPPATLLNQIKGMNKKELSSQEILLSGQEIIHISYPILNGLVGNAHLGISTGKIRAEVNSLIFKVVGILAVAFILISILGIIIADRTIVTPIKNITAVAEAVGRGDLTKEIQVKTHDEIGVLGKTLNETINRLRNLVQTEEDQRKTQENIINFLNLLSSASEGDLTQKAEVTPDVFGSIGDAFNLMVEGLTELIEKVRISAQDANMESSKILSVLKEMEEDSEMQTVEVRHAREAVEDAAQSATDITEKTRQAQKISEMVVKAIYKGNRLVLESIDGVQLIRATVQVINKRMKYLSERLIEIGTISQLITEVANRTNLLAINASIEAARAGEQGKGFVVIAEEIRSLAERATKSTKQIGEIISAIQVESAGITKHLEEETKYVEMETKLATDTGAAFKEIDASIKDTVTVISEIDTSANTQKELTSRVILSTEEVQRITREMLNLLKDVSNISASLSATSNALISSVERFKLPKTEKVTV